MKLTTPSLPSFSEGGSIPLPTETASLALSASCTERTPFATKGAEITFFINGKIFRFSLHLICNIVGTKIKLIRIPAKSKGIRFRI